MCKAPLKSECESRRIDANESKNIWRDRQAIKIKKNQIQPLSSSIRVEAITVQAIW